MRFDDTTEWLEADGLGGFASGTTSGVRMRRYHALLLAATTPPTGRMVLVNGVDAFVQTPRGTFALSSQRYAPDVVYPDGSTRIVAFDHEPWPSWEFETPDGVRIRHEIFAVHGAATTVLTWKVLQSADVVTLRVRPFLSGRDYHSLHHENPGFAFQPDATDDESSESVTFTPYAGVPAIEFRTDGEYRHSPEWYRNFLYTAERERGLDHTEDLASPGEFVWQLPPSGTAVCVLRAIDDVKPVADVRPMAVAAHADQLRRSEQARRAGFPSALDRAADAYLVQRNAGRTVVAGYPWFTDWGRDTFIAVRGLCLATGRVRDARAILLEWSTAVSEGMLPNRFPDRGEQAEFNAVDASLWYVVVVHELLELAGSARTVISRSDEDALRGAVERIVEGYAAGTRFGIRLDADGLLFAGQPGLQLTWMDARVGDRVITPRIGKPVEIQALWLNALAIAAHTNPRWRDVVERGRATFLERFWNDRGYLSDVVDVDGVPGTRDDAFRPNQVLAVGGLPVRLIDGVRAKQIVGEVERRLLTPLGLRSLAPGEPEYRARYDGDSTSRDSAYHQGTVWPWLLGSFVDAWLGANGNTPANRTEARRRFVQPLLDHLGSDGLGHVSEIADAEQPFTPRGCPFQAWSVGELIRVERTILAGRKRTAVRTLAQTA